SSRRRHTRFSRDWSSDVCSSDLLELGGLDLGDDTLAALLDADLGRLERLWLYKNGLTDTGARALAEAASRLSLTELRLDLNPIEIGRASCRESGEISGVAVAVEA